MIPGNALPLYFSENAIMSAIRYMAADSNLLTDHVSSTDIIACMTSVNADVYAYTITGKIVKSANSGANWTIFSRIVGLGTIRKVVYTGTNYVAVDINGGVATSPDQVTWTINNNLKATGFSSVVTDIIYAAGQVVVVSNNATVLTSPDGISWTARSGLIDIWGNVEVNAITYGLGKYVAVGYSSRIATSADGITWVNQASLAGTAYGSDVIHCITFGKNLFVLGGRDGKMATSPDGVVWTYSTDLQTATEWPTFSAVNSIMYGGGLFIVRTNNSTEYATSQDGFTWVAYLSSSVKPVAGTNMFFNNGTYYSYGGRGSMSYCSAFTAWMWPTDILKQGWGGSLVTAMLRLPDGRVVVSNSIGSLAISNDGNNWTYLTTLVNVQNAGINSLSVNNMAYGNGRLLIFESGNSATLTGVYYLSDLNDFTKFTRYVLGSSSSGCPIWDGSKFVSVGNAGTVRYSTDGITWGTGTDLSVTGWGTSTRVQKVIFTGSVYLAVSNTGKVARSLDGINWTYIGLCGVTTPNDAHWDGSVFVVVGVSGACATSPDGINWTTRASFTSVWGITIASAVTKYKNKIYVFGGAAKVARSSDNGVTWEMVPSPEVALWGGILISKCLATDNKILFPSTNTTNGRVMAALVD